MRISQGDAVQMYRNGATAQTIADTVGVSRERICQLLRPTAESQKKAERARIAREEVAAERAAIKASLEAERNSRIEKAVDLIMGGMSIRRAAAAAGMSASERNHYLEVELRQRGIESNWGKWRDFSERQRKIRELYAQGMNRVQIVEAVRAGGDENCSAQWIISNCADLKFSRGRRSRNHDKPAAVPAKQTKPPKPAPVDPDAFWIEQRVSKLKLFWFSGISAQQIADILGCTRNAVIGKVHRLRMAGDFQKEV